MPAAKLVIYKGEEYTLPDLARKVGMKQCTLWRRIFTLNMGVEEAVERPLHKHRTYAELGRPTKPKVEPKGPRRPFIYKGKAYSMRELCDLTGYDFGTMYKRYTTGYTVEEMVEKPLYDSNRNHRYSYKGTLYSITQLEAISGVKWATIQSRINNYNWSVEDAVETPAKQTKRVYTKKS